MRGTRHVGFDIAADADFGHWCVNGRPVSRRVAALLSSRFGPKDQPADVATWGPQGCPYCNRLMRRASFEDDWELAERRREQRHYVVTACSYCGHWEIYALETSMQCMDSPVYAIATSVAARYEEDLPQGCAQEIARGLRQVPGFWKAISPFRFERFVADVFRANYTNCDVQHVGKPADGGVDVLLVDDHSRRWLMQVKRRQNTKRGEGVETIRSILGALALRGERHGIVVSTADAFTYAANRARKDVAQYGYVLELLNRQQLDRLIGTLIPENAWMEAFRHDALQHVDVEVRDSLATQVGATYCDPLQLELCPSGPGPA